MMSQDEQEIRQLVADWMEFTRRGDMDAVLQLMTEDVVFLIAGRPPMIGRAAFAEASRAGAGQSQPQFNGHSEIQEIRIAGEWAFMWTKLKVVAKWPDKPESITRSGNTLSVLRKVDGVWKLWRDANMLTVEKPG